MIRAQFAESRSWVSPVLLYRECVCFEVMVVRLEVIPELLKIQIVRVLTLCWLASVSRLLSSGCSDPRRMFCTLLCYKASTLYFHSYGY